MVLAGQVGQLLNSTSENGLTFDSSRKNSVSPYGGQRKMKNDSETLQFSDLCDYNEGEITYWVTHISGATTA